MNTQTPADIDLALRKHVERAVRPVRAGKCKKLAMREELFAHLMAIFLEEQSKRTDQQAALSAAVERFGEPAALTAELNASIGWIERIDYWEHVIDQKIDSWFSVRTDESWLRFALRWATFFGLFNSFFGLLMLSVALAQTRAGDSTSFSALWKCLLMLTLTQPAGLLGIRGVYVALRRPTAFRWVAALLQAFAWTFVEIVVVLGFWWSMSGSLITNPQIVGVFQSFLIGLPPFLLLGGWLCTLAKRNQDKHAAWTLLAIDE